MWLYLNTALQKEKFFTNILRGKARALDIVHTLHDMKDDGVHVYAV